MIGRCVVAAGPGMAALFPPHGVIRGVRGKGYAAIDFR
jgi:hypothetical protein